MAGKKRRIKIRHNKKALSGIIILIAMLILVIYFKAEYEFDKDKKVHLANPSATYCINQGYSYEIRINDNGSYGVCIFGNGEECGGWDYYHGGCDKNKECEIDSDCRVFAKDKYCNCECYNKNHAPQVPPANETGEKCFCAEPKNCSCANNKCEGKI